jgi:pilus assembly protein CpaB
MRRRLLIIISCALILSACAGYAVYRVAGHRPEPGNTMQTTRIVLAARDLEVGGLIRAVDLKTVDWPGPVPKNAIVKTESALNRGVISPIYDGEPLTENRLAPQGSAGGLAATIPAGMRACAVKVNEVVGVAGFVVSGMRVDVLITGLPPGGNALDGPRVRTLLQNIAVLSAGTNFQKDQEGKPEQAQVVNLLVTPEQAEILSLASNETHIQLVLRNPMDTQVSKPPGTEMSDLFGSAQHRDQVTAVAQRRTPVVRAAPAAPVPAAAMPPPPPPYIVEVSNGAVQTQARFAGLPEKR